MKLKTITLGLVTLATLGSASAFAAPPDIARKQVEVRGVLDSFKLDLKGDQATFNPRGRRDLVTFTNRDSKAVVADLKDAYFSKRTLANGYRVIGWAHLKATDSYTFTMKTPSGELTVTEVFSDPQGARVHIWGMAHNPQNPVRSTRTDIPKRFSPVRGDSIVR